MGSVPFAFSVHHFINSVGADAGFASIIGLAILILLYFAHARETASLRNHAYEASERIQKLEAQVAQLDRNQSAAQAARAVTAGAPAPARQVPEVAPAAGRLSPGIPIAPAGVAAPALTAATRLIPAPAQAAVAPAGAVPDAAAARDATVVTGAPAPATVAGGSNGHGQDPPRPVLAPAATQTPPPRTQLRPQGTMPPTRRPQSPLRTPVPPRSSSSGAARIVLAVIGVLALGGVVAALVILTSSSGSSNSNAGTGRTTNAPGSTRTNRQPAVVPSSVTVAVLNGTATAGLAHRIALNLSSAGYKEGTIATATDQTRTTTTVAYLPGFKRDALAVAKSLKLQPSAVSPVDQSTQQVACPPPGSCNANVVVTVGADLSTTQ